MAGQETRDPKQSNFKLENAIPVLIGHHSVPPFSKTKLSPGFFITHLKATDSSSVTSNEGGSARTEGDSAQNTNKEKSVEQRHLTKLFESVKNNRNFFYTVIASVGIPVALLFVFYFEVSSFTNDLHYSLNPFHSFLPLSGLSLATVLD